MCLPWEAAARAAAATEAVRDGGGDGGDGGGGGADASSLAAVAHVPARGRAGAAERPSLADRPVPWTG